jgi:cell division protein FtsW (lipid II flippase)
MLTRNAERNRTMGAVVFCTSLLMLVFLSQFERPINAAIRNLSFGDQCVRIAHFTGISLRKIIYVLMNWGLLLIVFAPMKNEDERIEKIRNYAYRQTFTAIVAMALMTGLVVKDSPGILVLAIIMQLYYLFLFRLCLYRDSKFVYLNEDQKISAGLKMVKRSYRILIIIACLVAGLIVFLIRNDPSQLWVVLVICVAIMILAGTTQALWKK